LKKRQLGPGRHHVGGRIGSRGGGGPMFGAPRGYDTDYMGGGVPEPIPQLVWHPTGAAFKAHDQDSCTTFGAIESWWCDETCASMR